MKDLQLYINDELVDAGKNDLGIYLNYTLFNPEKLTASTDTEYSFTFKLPTSDKNNRIFGNANVLSVENKFNKIYKAELTSDGTSIFTGQVLLKSIDDENYNCNLIVKKGCDLDSIFGDMTLDELDWYMPFDGAVTINSVNADTTADDAIFPLVSYGVFQKKPYESDEVANEYTSKFAIDEYNKFWVETFYPSLSLTKALKKCFEKKGYNVGGNIFTDTHLKNVYMSTNLADEQIPTYNLGNPKFGNVSLDCTLNNATSGVTYYEQELNFPYDKIPLANDYKFTSIDVYDMLGEGNVSIDGSPTYMFDNGDSLIVIPADGFYKIDLSVDVTLNSTGNITVMQKVVSGHGTTTDDRAPTEMVEFTLPVGLAEWTPVEIQLVKNYEDSIELIKGKNNKRYVNGNPNSASTEWITCFPHEDAYASDLPTKANDLTVRNTIYYRQGAYNGNGTRSRSQYDGSATTRGGGTRERTPAQQQRNYNSRAYGYYNNDTTIMAYDPAVTDGFICGFSSLMGGTPAVIKNGKSWSKSYAEKTYSFYNQEGYTYMDVQGGYITNIPTTFNENTYIDAPTGYFNISGNRMVGSLSCIVHLNRNDILQLMEIHRHYENSVGNDVVYNTTTNVSLNITAASPKSYNELLAENFGYNSNSEFDYDLRLSNFLNNETKASEFVQGAIRAFNLEIIEDGNNITLNKKRKTYGNTLSVVDINGKASPRDATTSMINYPATMAMKWQVDTDEWGFEESVPQEYINQDDWADYGDYGYEVINMSNSIFSNDNEEVSVPFSYTWYSNFDINSGGTITIPVISSHEWMIDGYDYEESAKHDGYSLKQRFWFRNAEPTPYSVTLSSYPPETVNVYTPKRDYLNMALSYKLSEKSLLSQYFNTKALVSSNYVELEVYLTSEEYQLLKAGSNVAFDKDIYYIVKMSNYDPSENNPTKITLMKSSSAPAGGEEIIVEPIYRWANIPISQDYVCSGTSKYYKQVKQVSYDGGSTWENAVPAEYQTGALYETHSVDCGYVPEPANYLTLHSITNNTYTFSKAVEYSVDDGVTWRSLAANEGTAIVAAGLNALFRGNISATSAAGVGTFTSTGTFSVSGNPMSLASGSSLINATMVDYQFMRLFNGCTGLTNAEDLELPATALTNYCYQGMFQGCTSLTGVPTLPATTLANWCYHSMFAGCTSLTTAPTLPATTLAPQCYEAMFRGCTSLTTAPSLPADTLSYSCYKAAFSGCTSLTNAPELTATALTENCYESMFYGCTSLTTAPSLPARTLAEWSYAYMFDGCTSLNSVTCLATDISASNSTYFFTHSVASTGTFVKHPSMDSWPSGANGIPTGWTVQNAH